MSWRLDLGVLCSLGVASLLAAACETPAGDAAEGTGAEESTGAQSTGAETAGVEGSGAQGSGAEGAGAASGGADTPGNTAGAIDPGGAPPSASAESSGAEGNANGSSDGAASQGAGGGAATDAPVSRDGSGGADGSEAAVGAGGAAPAGAGGGSGVNGSGESGGGASGAGGAAGVEVPSSSDRVTRSASTFTFRHFPIETNDAGVWDGPMSPVEQATETTFDTVVLENGSLRVTLLPAYGGRVLSVVHKPTGRELLYQNPIGTPYLMYQDIFYYDYLVIMGGIFPSFPEPEHGRYWNLPYELELVSESDEAITVRMSRRDDLELTDGVPAVYDVGRTDVLVELEVTLRAGQSSLELVTTLTNTRTTPVQRFEYWTVTTLAPGSLPGETAIPLSTRIVAEMENVHLLESSWSWFGAAEQRVSDEIFVWNNLAQFANWVDQGTAFAYPQYAASWSGLINLEREVGILRVSDNVETPGLKLWTFGRGSLEIDTSDSDEWLRPTIEMWHGVTPEFWDRGTLAAGEVRSWSEHYFPTFGLTDVTSASEHGALQLSSSLDGAETRLEALATLTLPDQTVRAVLRLDGRVIDERDVVVASAEATRVEVAVPSVEIAPGAVFEAEFLQGSTSLLSGQRSLD